MSIKRRGINNGVRYSEVFKMEVVRELEENDLAFMQVARKYGIRDSAEPFAVMRST